MTIEIDGRRVSVTSLDRVLWPHPRFTKRALLDYYTGVAPVLVPHLAGRPVMLGRWPAGIVGRGWGQFDCRGRPAWMRGFPMELRAGGSVELCVIDEPAALLWAANQGTIELHSYGGRVESFDEPLALVLDLDPGDDVGLLMVAAVALKTRQVLAGVGLESVVKTSGGAGAHVIVPLNSPHSYEATRAFARTLAERLAANDPARVIARMSRAERAGRVFIDWAQNGVRRQTVAPYSLRVADVPRVSTPVTWDEVEGAVRAGDERRLLFAPEQVVARVRARGDLFAPALSLRQRLPEIGALWGEFRRRH